MSKNIIQEILTKNKENEARVRAGDREALAVRVLVALAIGMVFSIIIQTLVHNYRYDIARWGCANGMIKNPDFCAFMRLEEKYPDAFIIQVRVPCLENMSPPCFGLGIANKSEVYRVGWNNGT